MRFLAPLSVFIFGISTLLCRYFYRNTRHDFVLWCYFLDCFDTLGLGLLVGPEHHDHVATVQLGGRFDFGDVGQLLDEAIEDLLSEFGMRGFTSAEHDRDLYLVTLVQELFDQSCLGIEVAGTDLGPVLHLLDAHVLGLAPRLFRFLRFVELELAVVHDATNGWTRGRRDLHEIEVQAAGQRQRFAGRHHTTLIALVVDEANCVHTNAFIDAVVSRHCCDNALLPLRDATLASPRQAGRKLLEPGALFVFRWTLDLPTSLAVNCPTTLADHCRGPGAIFYASRGDLVVDPHPDFLLSSRCREPTPSPPPRVRPPARAGPAGGRPPPAPVPARGASALFGAPVLVRAAASLR